MPPTPPRQKLSPHSGSVLDVRVGRGAQGALAYGLLGTLSEAQLFLYRWRQDGAPC